MGWIGLTLELVLALSAVCLVLNFEDEAKRSSAPTKCFLD